MEKYVRFGGIQHPFTTEKEKKALIKQAQNYSRYVIIDGISITVKVSFSDCAEIAKENARAQDNKK